jgi:hypothetical protein
MTVSEFEKLVNELRGDAPSVDASYRDPDKAYFITAIDIKFNAIILNEYLRGRL